MTKLKQEMLPHIVSLIDVFEEKNTAYIVEDYIDGITLNEYMKQHTVFSAKQITAIIKPVLKSMVKIHNMGLIHRDISPDNLMITRDYAIYLIDFGSACYWENLDKDDTILVKPGFTPPESYVHDQVSGPWSDIYSMAATMFYAMAGRAPVESIKRTDDTYFDYLLSVCKDLTNFQIRALQGGLMLDPEKRYRKMEDFMSMLYNINNVYEESLEGKSKNKILKIFNKN
jgi:serine/threonine protein kinase